MSSRVERVCKIALYALLYAAAATLLVLFAPSDPQVFIYQEF